MTGIVCAASACSSTNTSISAPSPAQSADKCVVSVGNDTTEFPAGGGTGTLTVATSRDCTWSASADAPWVTPAATAGQGPAAVKYSVLPNPVGISRRTRLVVAESAVDVAQAAAPCRFDVSPSTVNVDAAEHQVVVTLTATAGCAWTVRSDAAWIGRAAPTDGTGSATVRLTVSANVSAARTGTVAFGNATVRVNQSAAAAEPAPPPAEPLPNPTPTPGPPPPSSCSYAVASERTSIPAAGDNIAVTVTTTSGCSWKATSNVPWIILGDAAGSGTGALRISISENTGPVRTGTISIAGQTITLTQAAAPPQPCSYDLAPASRSVGAAPESFAVSVTAPARCTWTASSDVPWITVAGETGSGSGSFRVTAAENAAGPRIGTVRVANQTLTVQQAGACTYGLKPNDYHSGRGPDSIAIEVTASGGCSWTATTDAGWITIAAGRGGVGNGTVRLEIQANGGPARTAVVTIAGKAFTVLQDAGCTPAIKPGFYDAGRGPDRISIRVSADPGCTWTAASTVSWVAVAEGSTGSGDGLVRLLVEPNSGEARAVTLTIAGQPFALTQEGQKPK